MAKQFSRFKKLTPQEQTLVDAIVKRAVEHYQEAGEQDVEPLSVRMDLHAVHSTLGLRLEDMLRADRFNFMHDVSGIARHLDRETGQLTSHFLPRFAQHMRKGARAEERELTAGGMAYLGKRKGAR